MTIKVEKEEQYILVTPEEKMLDEKEVEQLEDKLIAHLEDGRVNLILNLSNVETVSDDFYYLADKIYNILLKEEGIMVITEAPEQVIAKLAEYPLVITPTQDEAVDYIFMEELEKQLREEDKDPLWE
ncbi:MAG: hypothetical protein M3Q97_09160 [Bacteroidota bacterium]|nr:hypothetical protein [Bacteroidota bacterium]